MKIFKLPQYRPIIFNCKVFFLLFALLGCTTGDTTMEIGKIISFKESAHTFSVDVKAKTSGWHLGIEMDDIEANELLLDSNFSIILLNPNDAVLKVSFRENYIDINSEQERTVYQGTFRDFWYNGGIISVFNGEPRLAFNVKLICEGQPELFNPIKIFLYLKDDVVFPFKLNNLTIPRSGGGSAAIRWRKRGD